MSSKNRKLYKRSPKCSRCRNHGIKNALKGHKQTCLFKECVCMKCLISADTQKNTADRIALYRQLVRAEKMRKTEFHSSKSDFKKESAESISNSNIDNSSTAKYKDVYIDLNDSKKFQFNVIKTEKMAFPFITSNINSQPHVYRDYNEHFYKGSFSQTSCNGNLANLFKEKSENYDSFQILQLSDKYNCPLKILKHGVCCSELYCPVRSYCALKRNFSIKDKFEDV
ncbi:uncharacterized protein LOC124806106 [Hydra vulgaris]|uniref:Uncharacterized protein LOC124806106 n=1 Tax=Hydra vulgaris TaxID=6087 RepID=A0ABM4DH89_HYDVU